MSLRRHLAWMALSQGGFFVIQFVASVIIARLISPYEMGVYVVAISITGVLSIMQTAGLTGFIVREAKLNDGLLASAFTINAVICLLVAGLILGASGLAGSMLHSTGVRHVMLVVAIIPIIGIFEFLPAARLEREADFKVIAMIGSGRTLIAQGLSVVLAIYGYSFMSIAYGQVAGALFSALAYSITGRRYLSFGLRLLEWRRIANFGMQMLAVSGANAIGARLSDILLGRIISLTALGLYGRAGSINALIQDNIYMVIVRVLFVDIAEQVRAGKSLRKSYLATIEILSAVLWPAFAGLGIVAGPFIRVVYGEKWVQAAPVLLLLAIASMVHVMVSLSWQLFVVREEVNRQTRIEFLRTIAGVSFFAIGCSFGLIAAAASRIAEAVFTVAIYRPHIGRMTETTTRDFIPIYRRSALLTAATVAPAVIVLGLHGWSAATSLLQLVPAILCGVGIWFAGILWFDHPLAAEIRRVFRHLKTFVAREQPPETI